MSAAEIIRHFVPVSHFSLDIPLTAVVGANAIAVFQQLRRQIWRSTQAGDGAVHRLSKEGYLVARVSQRYLYTVVGICRTTLQNVLNKMEALGWLKRYSEKVLGGKVHCFILGRKSAQGVEIYAQDLFLQYVHDCIVRGARQDYPNTMFSKIPDLYCRQALEAVIAETEYAHYHSHEYSHPFLAPNYYPDSIHEVALNPYLHHVPVPPLELVRQGVPNTHTDDTSALEKSFAGADNFTIPAQPTGHTPLSVATGADASWSLESENQGKENCEEKRTEKSSSPQGVEGVERGRSTPGFKSNTVLEDEILVNVPVSGCDRGSELGAKPGNEVTTDPDPTPLPPAPAHLHLNTSIITKEEGEMKERVVEMKDYRSKGPKKVAAWKTQVPEAGPVVTQEEVAVEKPMRTAAEREADFTAAVEARQEEKKKRRETAAQAPAKPRYQAKPSERGEKKPFQTRTSGFGGDKPVFTKYAKAPISEDARQIGALWNEELRKMMRPGSVIPTDESMLRQLDAKLPGVPLEIALETVRYVFRTWKGSNGYQKRLQPKQELPDLQTFIWQFSAAVLAMQQAPKGVLKSYTTDAGMAFPQKSEGAPTNPSKPTPKRGHW